MTADEPVDMGEMDGMDLPDDFPIARPGKPKPGKGVTRKSVEREAKRSLEHRNAVRLAQISNLLIAGMSLTEIGQKIGASPEEVDRLLNQDMTRYVRNQPALRVFVRNYLSEKYTKLLDADWDIAVDKNHVAKLENQDRVLRILKEMGRLHGAEAPVQSEVKVEAAPEAVESLVKALSAQQGVDYDESIFDVVDAEVVHEAVSEAEGALLDATEQVGEGEDEPL